MSLALPEQFQLSKANEELVKKTVAYEQASLAAHTRRNYGSRWKKFSLWFEDNKLSPCPASAETISLFLEACSKSFK